MTRAAIVALALGLPAFAAGQEPLTLIRWLARTSALERPLARGDAIRIVLTATIDEGWHLYSTREIPNGPRPTTVALASGQPFSQAGLLESPYPRIAADTTFNTDVEFYEESAVFVMPVRYDGTSRSRAASVTVEVRFQACNDELCLAPQTVRLEAPLRFGSD